MGVCTNPQCARAASGELVECYPGPGEYCPDCGSQLTAVSAERFAFLGRLRNRVPRASLLAALLVIGAFVLGGTGLAVSRSINSFGVRVCSTTMTDRVVGDVVRTYTSRKREWPYHYNVGAAGDAACDVRFGTATSGAKEAVIAHDGVVVVVNPLNPITRMTMSQLRDVMTGRIVDWSQLGGRSGAILAILPKDGSDEARIFAETVMQRQNPGEHVVHAASTAEVVRSVTTPSGIRSVGIASFSGSSPAKVIAFEVAPPPSPLSIAANRYPMSVRIVCTSDFRSPTKAAAGLVAFALSDEAQRLVARTGLLSRDGF